MNFLYKVISLRTFIPKCMKYHQIKKKCNYVPRVVLLAHTIHNAQFFSHTSLLFLLVLYSANQFPDKINNNLLIAIINLGQKSFFTTMKRGF